MGFIVMAYVAHRSFKVNGIMAPGALCRRPNAVWVSVTHGAVLFFFLKGEIQGPTVCGGSCFIEMATAAIGFGMGPRQRVVGHGVVIKKHGVSKMVVALPAIFPEISAVHILALVTINAFCG